MALIQTTPPEKADGKLAELYAEVEQMFGESSQQRANARCQPGSSGESTAAYGALHGSPHFEHAVSRHGTYAGFQGVPIPVSARTSTQDSS